MAKKPDPTPEDIMSPAEMKPILARAKRGDAASAVIGLTTDKQGVILLDKKVKPKQLVALLRKQAEAAGLEIDRSSLRFGTASVDTEVNAALVSFTLNKEAPGVYELKMLAILKKAGFAKVEFKTDVSLENEPDTPAPSSPEEQKGQTRNPEVLSDTAQPSAPSSSQGFDFGPLGDELEELVKKMPAAAERTPDLKDSLTLLSDTARRALQDNDIQSATSTVKALREAVNDAMTRETGDQPPKTEPTAQDPAKTTEDAMKHLADRLAKLMPAVKEAAKRTPSFKDNLVTLSSEIVKLLKAKDAMSTELSLGVLEDEIKRAEAAEPEPAQTAGTSEHTPEAPAAPSKAPASPAAIATLAKTKTVWTSTRTAIEKQLDTLQGKMAEAYDGHGFAADLEKVFKSKVEPMLGTLDHSLAEVLDEVAKSTDGTEQAKLVKDAQTIIGKYEAFLAGEPLIKKLDKNPFLPMQIEATLTKTLEALSKSVASVAEKMNA